MNICEIQVQIDKSVTRIRGRRLGPRTEFCIPSINIATQLEFAQNYLILFTFCNNLLIQFEFCKKYVPFFWGYSSQRDTLQPFAKTIIRSISIEILLPFN